MQVEGQGNAERLEVGGGFRLWPPGQGANLVATVQQQVGYGTTLPSGRPGDEDGDGLRHVGLLADAIAISDARGAPHLGVGGCRALAFPPTNLGARYAPPVISSSATSTGYFMPMGLHGVDANLAAMSLREAGSLRKASIR